MKARQATILSWYLHELKAATYTLWEAIRMTVTKVNAKEGGDPVTHFTVIWINYVRERLLADWMIGDPSSEGPGLTLTAGAIEAEVEKLWEGEPTGHAADQLYVNKAKEGSGSALRSEVFPHAACVVTLVDRLIPRAVIDLEAVSPLQGA